MRNSQNLARKSQNLPHFVIARKCVAFSWQSKFISFAESKSTHPPNPLRKGGGINRRICPHFVIARHEVPKQSKILRTQNLVKIIRALAQPNLARFVVQKIGFKVAVVQPPIFC
ncbi:hypothetical protein [Helicobacter sp. 23-1045]